jgi:hypothetical protein
VTATVTVVVPYRGDDDGPRDRAFGYVQRWWREQHPDWPLRWGTCPADGPWRKGVAVACALAQPGPLGEVLVIADADVICPAVTDAVDIIAAGQAGWAIPHKRVNRLGEAATAAVLAGGALPAPPYVQGGQIITNSYVGAEGGGMVVLPAEVYRRCPIDNRFSGWGQEDTSWALALRVLAGRPWRNPYAPLLHLWHPAAARVSSWQGCPANVALFLRYQATTTPEGILAIQAEQTHITC